MSPDTFTAPEAPAEAPPAAEAGRRRRALRRVAGLNELGVIVALATMVVFIGAFHPGFFEAQSFVNISRQASFFGIMALGMVFLLAMREIDLSVGGIYGVTIVGAALLIRDGWNPWLGALAGILIGVGLGAVNGLLSNGLKISTIVVTLGSLSMFRGLALVLSDGQPIVGLPREQAFFRIFGGDLLGIPAIVWSFAVLTIALTILFRYTRFGFLVRAIGSNDQAARLSGMPIARVRLLVLMLVGGLCGVSGMLTLAFFQSADPSNGIGYELLVIAAAIIGGTSLAGGSGTVFGALLGAFVIATITSGLVQFGVTANWTSFVTGAVIIGAVALDALIRRRRAGVVHQT